jgi:hypothetical protein
MVATIRYCETISLNSSLTPAASVNIACNSIYDPNLTNIGHQPYGHDTYASIYNQYTVLKSKIQFRIGAPGTGAGGSNAYITWGGGIEDTVTSTSAADYWMERPTYKSRIQTQQGSAGNTPLTLYWDRAKRFPHEDLYRTVSAPFGSNPSEIEVFNLVAQANTPTGVLGQVYCTVIVDYTCEFYELKDLGTS